MFELGSFSLLYYSSNPGLSDDVDWIRSDLADFDLGDLRLLEALTLGKLLSARSPMTRIDRG